MNNEIYINNFFVQNLSQLLANTYVLFLKTQNCHWNVKDVCFSMFHSLFEKQYKELAEASDDIAERIRTLGHLAPATFSEFLELSSLNSNEKLKTAKEMLDSLLKGHNKIVEDLKKILKEEKKGEKGQDEGTIDLFIERLRYHEKTAWILRSHTQA